MKILIIRIMKNLIPEFHPEAHGAYMFKHVATDKIYLSYGKLNFSVRHDIFLLRLGIHCNQELQNLYNKDDDVQIIVSQVSDDSDSAADIARDILEMFLENEIGSAKLLNVDKEIHPVNTTFTNEFVDQTYNSSNLSTNVYNEFSVYTLYNRHTKAFYIGSGDRATRKYRHFKLLKDGRHGNRQLQKAYELDSRFDFFWVPMLSRKEAYAFEQNLIDRFFGNEEFLNISSLVGFSDGMKGKKHSDKTKAMISIKSKEHWNNSERRKRKSEESSQWWKWLSQEDRESHLKNKSKITKELWDSEEYRTKVIGGINKSWTKDRRKKVGEIAKARMSSPEVKQKYSSMIKSNWENLEYRTAVTNGIKAYSTRDDIRKARSDRAKEYFNRPEIKAVRTKNMQDLFANPTYREANSNRLREYNEIYSKRIVINEVEYVSIREASRVTGLSRSFIKKKYSI